ncbi:MAG: TPM domain-containing protein [Saccharofermentanales bacterium]|jgi:uncharacterized protein|nr:TPM domain-containing protein [Clostridiaceae bacterium]
MVIKRRTPIALTLMPVIVAALMLLAVSTVRAEKRLVVDQADVLTWEQEQELEAAAAAIGSAYEIDCVIVTTNDTEGKSSMEYADDFFDYNGYGVGENNDGVLLLLDFQNRMFWISTTGKAIDVLTDQRIEKILDAVEPGMVDGDYYSAAQAFLNKTDSFFKGNTLTLVEGILGFLASGGAGVGVIGSVRRRYKGKSHRPTFAYKQNSLVDMGVSVDDLIKSYTTSRTIPQSSSSSGGGGGGGSSTHTSSSGSTHGGGGRSF